MLNLTPLVRPLFARRIAQTRAAERNIEQTQRAELARLLHAARRTWWGERYGYRSLASYADYAEAVPVTPYPELREAVMRMISGEKDVLWPGRTRCFAQSSGTSDGKSKYIPITPESFRRSHYRGASDVVAHYLNLHPESRIFAGRSFILGGSFANELSLPADSRACVGDLSASLIRHMNPLAGLYRIPSRKVALMADWSKKLPLLAEAALKADVTNISGVPSWFHTVLCRMLEISGAKHIHEIWPNLEVFFHGGISMKPYRDLYNGIIDPARMNYLETYNASEGFFAVQDTPDPDAGMLLLLDCGTFYEFLPVDNPDAAPLPAWQVKKGEIYSLIISSCNGLWRYPIGDTVRVTSDSPLRIEIAGRTKCFINAFGEEVMVHNTDAALARTCALTGARVLNYTAAPVFTTRTDRGYHQWLIEFATPPASLDEFAAILDRTLQEENSDYQAKRSSDIFLAPLQITVASPGVFDRWLASTGRLGGQRKVPRLANDRHIIDPLLALNR